MMIDWITGQIQATSSDASRLFETGRFQQISRDGEVIKEFASRIVSEGSYDSGLTFRAPSSTSLELSGNPAKYLQGHNLFGSADYSGLFFEAGMIASQKGAMFPTPREWEYYEYLLPRFTRLDITRSYQFENDAQARAWIKAVAGSAHTRHKNSVMTNGTAYFGKTSTRWSFKIYCKSDEINSKKKGHELSSKLRSKDVALLKEWAVGVVRFELTIRSKEIQKNKIELESDLLSIWEKYFAQIKFNKNSEVIAFNDEVNLSRSLSNYLLMWKLGTDLRQVLTKSSFYRVRRELSKVGIDVAEQFALSKSGQRFQAELNPKRFDPEPIEDLMWRPDPDRVSYFIPEGLSLSPES